MKNWIRQRIIKFGKIWKYVTKLYPDFGVEVELHSLNRGGRLAFNSEF